MTKREFLAAGLGTSLALAKGNAAFAQQAAAQVITTALVLVNGTLVGSLVIGTFQALIAIVNTGVMW